jgi:hypothetical protein
MVGAILALKKTPVGFRSGKKNGRTSAKPDLFHYFYPSLRRPAIRYRPGLDETIEKITE